MTSLLYGFISIYTYDTLVNPVGFQVPSERPLLLLINFHSDELCLSPIRLLVTNINLTGQYYEVPLRLRVTVHYVIRIPKDL